ncbi:hypothetical protein ACWIF5_30655, partial [Streptomyces sp. NPDC055509]
MTLTIGALTAEPGQKTRGSLSADLGSTTVEVPATLGPVGAAALPDCECNTCSDKCWSSNRAWAAARG